MPLESGDKKKKPSVIRKVRASKGHRKRKQRIRKVSSWKMAVELNF